MNIEIIRYGFAAVVMISLLIILAVNYRSADSGGFPRNIDRHDGDRRLKECPFDKNGNPRQAA